MFRAVFSQAPNVFVYNRFQPNLMFFVAGPQLRPDHPEFHAVLMELQNELAADLQLPANGAEPCPSSRDIESVNDIRIRIPGHVRPRDDPYWQHRFYSVCPPWFLF